MVFEKKFDRKNLLLFEFQLDFVGTIHIAIVLRIQINTY